MANLCDTLFQKPLKCCVTKKSMVRKIDFSTLFRSRKNLKNFLSCSPELSTQYCVTHSKMRFFGFLDPRALICLYLDRYWFYRMEGGGHAVPILMTIFENLTLV